MKIIAIDPGTWQSAFVVYDHAGWLIHDQGIVPNDELASALRAARKASDAQRLVIEQIKSYGNVMGDTTLETCVWIGRFIEAWGREFELIPRKTVATQLCNHPRAKDSNISQALKNRFYEVFGPYPNERGVVGTKRAPGPLYLIKNDMWSALGVAVSWSEIKELENRVFNEVLN